MASSAQNALRQAAELEAASKPNEALAVLARAWEIEPGDPTLAARFGLACCGVQRELDALDLLDCAGDGPQARELAQTLADHFHCREQMAAHLGIQDPSGRVALERLQTLWGLVPSSTVGIGLSACLIVKNEADHLPACLESLRRVADEIVVVDTGSTDETEAIAKSFGASIGHFEWCDDFAAARNAALGLCTQPWVLWIDADERLTPESVTMLREALMRPRFGGYLIRIVNFLADEGEGERFVHAPVRLFRNLPGVAFEGRVHEQVMPSLERLGFASANLGGVELIHVGYRPAEMEARGKMERMRALLAREVEDDPDSAFPWFNLATALAVEGDFLRTEAAARQAIARLDKPYSFGGLCYHLLATSLLEQRRVEEALATCDACDRAGFGSIVNEFERGTCLLRLGRLDEAIRVAEGCLRLDWPTELNGDYGIFTHKRQVLYAQALVQSGRVEEALPWIQAALNVDPGYLLGRYTLGVALLRIREFKAAIPELRVALALAEYRPMTLALLARCHAELGDWEAAAEMLETRWDEGGTDHDHFVERVRCYEALGDSAKVMRAYEQWAESNELSPEMLTNWGRSLAAQGQSETALACFAEAVRRSPEDPNALYNCGDLLYRLGQYPDAAHLYEQALRLAPTNPEGWFVLGNALFQMDFIEAARKAYEQALDLRPGHAAAAANLAQLNAA